ncbi:alpha/beta hydrolase [Frateuria aurantia]
MPTTLNSLPTPSARFRRRPGLALSLLTLLAVSLPLSARADATPTPPATPDSVRFQQWEQQPGISPELAQLRQLISRYFLSVPANASMDQKRTARANLYLQHIPLPADLHFSPVDAGAVHGEWSDTPTEDRQRVLLYLHGGGYVVGSVKGWRVVGPVVGRAAGMRTFSVEYRLAPEHPYPAALDDAIAAYRYLLAAGYAPQHIAFAGDSAGGGLALATLLKARQLGLPMPAAAFVMSPWTDLTMSGHSIDHPLNFDPFNRHPALIGSANKYLAGHSPTDPLVSPLFADLGGLPPLLIQVGDEEAYRDDATGLARRAADYEVKVQLQTWPHVFHVWQAWTPQLPEAREAVAKAAVFLKQATGGH